MDLGIAGKKALVCASSQGLGHACALALAQEGCEVFINGRDSDKLARAAQAIAQSTGARVTPVTADVSSPAGRAALLAACPQPDILVNNNAGPPPGRLSEWDHAAWMGALEANFLAAAFLMQAVLPGMRERKFGRIVNITSAMVKSPHEAMGLSTAARAGLTALAKALSRSAIADNVTINNLLPERFDTARQQFMVQRLVREQGLTHDDARRQITDTVPAGRFGEPAEFGAACAFLCSAHSGFTTGQNLQLDGGAYQGLI
ncbi:SDR family oxidoreductase [soil metagenome]